MVLLITPGERTALQLMAEGHGVREIAGDLGVGEHAVDAHLGSLFERMGVSCRAEAIGAARRRGLLACEAQPLDTPFCVNS
jgi:LuxR family transcriptional regulator, maltose regulon positive regulatory protein